MKPFLNIMQNALSTARGQEVQAVIAAASASPSIYVDPLATGAVVYLYVSGTVRTDGNVYRFSPTVAR